MLVDLSVQHFLDELASGEPAPGGGAVAALVGAQGAALLSMVCNLTIGRKKYASVEAEMQQILAQTESLRSHLTALIARDTTAYEAVMSAYKLPKDTQDQTLARNASIQAALQQATLTPLETLDACAAVLELGPTVLAKGNPNAASDGAAGILCAHAGMMAAALNVRINLKTIQDADFAAAAAARMQTLLARGQAAYAQTWALTEASLGN